MDQSASSIFGWSAAAPILLQIYLFVFGRVVLRGMTVLHAYIQIHMRALPQEPMYASYIVWYSKASALQTPYTSKGPVPTM